MPLAANQKKSGKVVLLAEDDDDDYILTRDAFRESGVSNDLIRVKDGEELMEYLHHHSRKPDVILLDLNMPRKDGRRALQEIKADAELSQIPVIVLTTSRSQEDIVGTYKLGVGSYIQKPPTFGMLCDFVKKFNQYWFETVALPCGPAS